MKQLSKGVPFDKTTVKVTPIITLEIWCTKTEQKTVKSLII